ncbi:MAG: A/G-specific adenine glycosylase [Syntrophotaleaceae bacterium]
MSEAGPISDLLLAWYGREGRDLPWRNTRDPYRIWLSEIMLQQTTVAAVIPYYQRFLDRFPSVGELAQASIDEVIALWAGLGYYSRARNLHAAARAVVDKFSGFFPDDLERLMELPGIGRSTAGAILSIAFDRKAPILDGNVRRVLIRLDAITEPPRSPAVEKRLWQRAEELTPEDRPHDYAQAIMDLGATVCTPRSPDCTACPLAKLCRAHALDLVEQLPAKQTKKTVPLVRQAALVLEMNGRFLVRQRPLNGMLGGLWEFPSRDVPADSPPHTIAEKLLASFDLRGCLEAAGTIRHAYSHFRVEVELFRARVECERVTERHEEEWLSAAELEKLPLHGAHKKVLPVLEKIFSLSVKR